MLCFCGLRRERLESLSVSRDVALGESGIFIAYTECMLESWVVS